MQFIWTRVIKYQKLLIFIVLIFLLKHSFDLRSINYARVPDIDSILDERTWVWQGLSIRQTGVPAGWSDLDAYIKKVNGKVPYQSINGFNLSFENKSVNLQNFYFTPKPLVGVYKIDTGHGDTYIRIVQPLVEQPPLGGLIFGSLIQPKDKSFSDVSSVDYRRVSLWIAIITQILIFVVGIVVFDSWMIGLLAAAIYGSGPSFILLSRLSLLENIISPLSLAVLVILSWLNKHHKTISLQRSNLLTILAGILAGLMALTKVTGYPMAFLLGSILIFYWRMGKKVFLIYLISFSLVSSIYFIWLASLNSLGIFWNVFRFQSVERLFFGSINFLTSIYQVRIRNFPPVDGWWLGGFISILFVPRIKENIGFWAGILVALAVALFFGVANYAWYFIPLVPFLCLATAYFIKEVIFNPSLFKSVIFYLIFFSSSLYWGYGVSYTVNSPSPSTYLQIYRSLLLIVIGLGIFLSSTKSIKYRKYWIVAMIVMLLFMLRLNDLSLRYILTNWGHLPTLDF